MYSQSGLGAAPERFSPEGPKGKAIYQVKKIQEIRELIFFKMTRKSQTVAKFETIMNKLICMDFFKVWDFWVFFAFWKVWASKDLGSFDG